MKTLIILVHAGLFWCFHNAPNSDMDYRIFNVRMSLFFACIYTRGTSAYSPIGRTFRLSGTNDRQSKQIISKSSNLSCVSAHQIYRVYLLAIFNHLQEVYV